MTTKSTEDDIKEINIYDVEYHNIINLESVQDLELRKIFQDSIPMHVIRDYRLNQHVRYFKHRILFDRESTVCISFRVIEHEITCAYAFVYGTFDTMSESFKPDLIVYGPALTSQDGEYRSHGLLWSSYEAFFTKYETVTNIVDELLCFKLDENLLQYDVDIHPAQAAQTKPIAKYIDENRLPIKLHILCWLYDYYAIHHDSQENHMNPIYKYLMHQECDLPFFEKVLDNLSDTEYQTMQLIDMSTVEHIKSREVQFLPLKCGQKLFPLLVDEYENPGDIRFPTWAEIYITNRCSNLSLNYISPSFPFIGNWFLISQSDYYMYDNEAMRLKFEHSNISSRITRKLDHADALNYVDDVVVAEDFARMSHQIKRARTFARAKLNLSPYTICLMSEFTGRTLKDSYHLSKTNSFEASHYIFTDPENAIKFVFELIYAFYSANTRMGTIHGDPHVNNITLFQTFFHWDPQSLPKWRKGHAIEAYFINNITYAFQYTGEHTVLIDFSRAFLQDRDAITAEFGDEIALDFFALQDSFMFSIVASLFPNLDKKKLNEFIVEYPSTAFKLFSVMDILISCRGLIQLITVDKIFNAEIEVIMIKLIKDIISFAETYTVKTYNVLLENPDSPFEWINLLLLEKFFTQQIMTTKQLADKNIITIFNHQAHLKNDIRQYNKWGDHVSFEAIRREFAVDWDNKLVKTKASYERLMQELKAQQEYDDKLISIPKEHIEIEPWMYS